jgi:hypothetical protein
MREDETARIRPHPPVSSRGEDGGMREMRAAAVRGWEASAGRLKE